MAIDSSCPITEQDVADIAGITLDSADNLDPFINAACALFDAKIGTLIGEGTLKNSILSYLAAHFASFSGVADGEFKAQSAIEEELGDAQVKFASGTTSTSSDLGSTNFGQSALTLDCTGRLALKTTAKRIQMMGLDNT